MSPSVGVQRSIWFQSLTRGISILVISSPRLFSVPPAEVRYQRCVPLGFPWEEMRLSTHVAHSQKIAWACCFPAFPRSCSKRFGVSVSAGHVMTMTKGGAPEGPALRDPLSGPSAVNRWAVPRGEKWKPRNRPRWFVLWQAVVCEYLGPQTAS